MKTYKTPINSYELRKKKTDFPRKKIASSRDVNEYVRQFYHEDIEVYESFFILLLNRANNTEGYAKISQGGTAGTVVDIKIIAKYCVDSLASSVIIVHNHPSGNTNPSNSDRRITERVKKALDYLEIQLLDHLILSPEGEYYSFADEGNL